MFWLALGYPLLAHLAVLLDDARLQWLALTWLMIVSLWGALARPRLWAWAALLTCAALLYWLVVIGHGLYALYVPPAAIPAALFVVFARSLRAGEIPLVTRIATLMRGEALPPPLVRYTRQTTVFWCGVFVAMFSSAVALALWATPPLWSLMTNVIHYVILGAIFVGEFVYRRIRFRALEPWSLTEYLRRLVTTHIKP